MGKQKMRHELVKIDFETNEYKFYNVEVLALGYNDLQVTFHYGKLGNEGRRTVSRLKSFKSAMKKAANRVHELKEEEGYMDLDDMKKLFEMVKGKKKEAKNKSSNRTYPCDICGKAIPENIYQKINKWGRGSGNWDSDVNLICYQKVLCIDCQIENDIYKKKL